MARKAATRTKTATKHADQSTRASAAAKKTKKTKTVRNSKATKKTASRKIEKVERAVVELAPPSPVNLGDIAASFPEESVDYDPNRIKTAQELIIALADQWHPYPHLVLAEEIFTDTDIVISRDVILDLNGHNIIATRNGSQALKIKGGNVTITGGGKPSKIFAEAPESLALRIYGSSNSLVTSHVSVTIDEDVTLFASDSYGILIRANVNASYGVEVNLRGHIIAREGIVIHENVLNLQGAPVINLVDGATIAAEYSAIRSDGQGVWQIGHVEMTGNYGLSLRAGVVNLSNTTIITSGLLPLELTQPSTSTESLGSVLHNSAQFPNSAQLLSSNSAYPASLPQSSGLARVSSQSPNLSSSAAQSLGGAIKIENHPQYINTVSIHIDGGTYLSQDGYVIFETNCGAQHFTLRDLTILSGKFSGARGVFNTDFGSLVQIEDAELLAPTEPSIVAPEPDLTFSDDYLLSTELELPAFTDSSTQNPDHSSNFVQNFVDNHQAGLAPASTLDYSLAQKETTLSSFSSSFPTRLPNNSPNPDQDLATNYQDNFTPNPSELSASPLDPVDLSIPSSLSKVPDSSNLPNETSLSANYQTSPPMIDPSNARVAATDDEAPEPQPELPALSDEFDLDLDFDDDSELPVDAFDLSESTTTPLADYEFFGEPEFAAHNVPTTQFEQPLMQQVANTNSFQTNDLAGFKADLSELISTAQSLHAEDYVAGFEELQETMQLASRTYFDHTSTDNDILSATSLLKNALANLVVQSPVTPPKTVQANANISPLYLQDEDLVAASFELNNYIANHQTTPQPVDFTNLEQLVAHVSSLSAANYSETSYQNLLTALSNAYTTLGDPEITQATVNEIIFQLEIALRALELTPQDPSIHVVSSSRSRPTRPTFLASLKAGFLAYRQSRHLVDNI